MKMLNYKKPAFWIVIIASAVCIALAVCFLTAPKARPEATIKGRDMQAVEHVGSVPDELRGVVAGNLFSNVTAFDGSLMEATRLTRDEASRTAAWRVSLLDVYANELASYSLSCDDAYSVTTLMPTSDGGFLFVLGFEDYACGNGEWASDGGYASRVIKCGSDGRPKFDTALDGVEGYALRFCFENGGNYYFFGTVQTPETKKPGIYSLTDVYMCVLDGNGAVLLSRCISGSDFDNLISAERTDGGFLLSVRSQSEDGDFTGSGSGGFSVQWVITVNDSLEITDMAQHSGRDSLDAVIGVRAGAPIYMSDPLLRDLDAGTPTAYIDYGDYYLIVSEHITGEYEHTPPTISSRWYYWETVYSGYDKSGELIFRAAVDSSPDYDARA